MKVTKILYLGLSLSVLTSCKQPTTSKVALPSTPPFWPPHKFTGHLHHDTAVWDANNTPIRYFPVDEDVSEKPELTLE